MVDWASTASYHLTELHGLVGSGALFCSVASLVQILVRILVRQADVQQWITEFSSGGHRMGS